MSDIFDMFGNEPVTSVPDKNGTPSLPTPKPMSKGAGDKVQALADAVGDLPWHTHGFVAEPDLTMLAYAVADILTAAGYSAEAIVAEQWAGIEASGRRELKIMEARARAEEVYRSDLEAIQEPRPALYLTEQSSLPWRQPGEPLMVSKDGDKP